MLPLLGLYLLRIYHPFLYSSDIWSFRFTAVAKGFVITDDTNCGLFLTYRLCSIWYFWSLSSRHYFCRLGPAVVNRLGKLFLLDRLSCCICFLEAWLINKKGLTLSSLTCVLVVLTFNEPRIPSTPPVPTEWLSLLFREKESVLVVNDTWVIPPTLTSNAVDGLTPSLALWVDTLVYICYYVAVIGLVLLF